MRTSLGSKGVLSTLRTPVDRVPSDSVTTNARTHEIVERIGNPKTRPRGAAPIEVLFFAYPRPPHRTH